MNTGRFRTVAVALSFVVAMGMLALAGCTSGQASSSSQQSSAVSSNEAAPTLANQPVSRDESFGGTYIEITIDDFNKLGFAYGDSVDVEFSNGYKLTDIPYYNGYYTNMGDPLLVGYPGYPYIEAAINFGDPLWDIAGLKQGDTATITLRQAGAYLTVQEALDTAYTNTRSDYASDEKFANFRTFATGSIKPGTVYRSASPIDNEFNRAAYVESLMKDAGVAFVLDLSDNPGEVDDFIATAKSQGVDVSYFEQLRDAGCVAMPDLAANYPSESYQRTLAGALVELSQHEGPYLIHCIEGKDRTGFVCMLLQALCGATYDEMLADYMVTYDNYYGITKESDPDKYAAIASTKFDDMARFLAHVDSNADLTSADYVNAARDYLRGGGMTDEQIDALIAKLTK